MYFVEQSLCCGLSDGFLLIKPGYGLRRSHFFVGFVSEEWQDSCQPSSELVSLGCEALSLRLFLWPHYCPGSGDFGNQQPCLCSVPLQTFPWELARL